MKVRRMKMKGRRNFLFMLLAALMGLTSCQEQAVENKFYSETLDISVRRSEWKFDDNTLQFYCHKDISVITAKIYDNGNWSLSREFDKGTNDAYQVALPMSMFMTDTLSDNSVVYYTQYLDYRLGIGYVEIQLTNSDYMYITDEKGNLAPPETMYFRLQLMY